MNEMQQNQSQIDASNENRDDDIPNLVNNQFKLIFNDSVSESLSDSDDSESQKSLSDLDNFENLQSAGNLLLKSRNNNIIEDESE